MKKTYTGSCHCGAVRFEADIDFAKGTSKCNCSICTKIRDWGTVIKPADFRLLAGENHLADYWFASRRSNHQFCKHCGVGAFARGDIAEIGGPFVAIQVACLDDVTPEELLEAPIIYQNGRDNAWWEPPKETRHL